MTDSALPPQQQEEGTMYSESDVQHLVAREVMKHRMNDYERGLSSLTNQVKDSNAKVDQSLKSLNESLERHYQHTSDCREDLRNEIERDFVTKLEFTTEMSKLDTKIDAVGHTLSSKIDGLTIKIATAVTVSGGILGTVAKITGVI